MDDEVMYEKTGLTSGVLGKTFLWMFMGLLATGFIAWYSYSSGYVLKMNFQLLAIIELLVVLVFSFGFRKLPATVVTVLYFGYAILNGFTFSVIFYVFELNSIVSLFFVTAGMFGALAYVGIKTERDLTSFGNFLYAGLFAGIIITLINLFMKNSTVDIVLDWVILAIFLGITVYDVNKIKKMEEYEIMEPDKLYIYGAMEIYLDFINIFIRLLSLFGKRK